MQVRLIERAAASAIALFLGGCAAPNRPDHGSYTTTGTSAPVVQAFVFPRNQRAAVVPPAPIFSCATERTARHLRERGVVAEVLPEGSAASDGALLVVVRVESLQGPGAFWNPFSGAIASTHARTDISLAIHASGQPVALWRAGTRVRAALTCADDELLAQLQQLLTYIR